MTFVFYDTETTGTDTAFDQILQFGAIRTDDNLNEIDRFETRCRLQPHIVPAPMALKVTGVAPKMLLDPTLPIALRRDETCARQALGMVAVCLRWIQFDLI